MMKIKQKLSVLKHGSALAGLVSAFVAPELLHADVIESSKSKARSVQLMEVTPDLLPQIKGQTYEDLSLQAVDASGKLLPIPFQFDEYNRLGLHHVKGGDIETLGQEGVFDEKDELVFMNRDAGQKATPEQLTSASGKVLSELSISDDGQVRYVYLLKGNSARSQKDYAEYDAKTHTLKTDTWSMQTDPNNALLWTDHFIKSFDGGKTTFADTMKVRVMAKVGFFSITLDNDNVVGKVVAVKDGPVRDIVQVATSVVVMKIPFLTLNMGLEISESSLDLPVSAAVPAAAKAIKAPVLTATLDFANVAGALVRSGLGSKEPSVVDNKMSAEEKKFGLSQQEPWLALSTDKGYAGFMMIQSDEVSLGKGLSLTGIYKEGTEEDKPERFPGSEPEMGFHITNLPPGDVVNFVITLFHVDKYWYNNTPEDFVHALLKQPEVSAKSL
jgi:hypothetical protein